MLYVWGPKKGLWLCPHDQSAWELAFKLVSREHIVLSWARSLIHLGQSCLLILMEPYRVAAIWCSFLASSIWSFVSLGNAGDWLGDFLQAERVLLFSSISSPSCQGYFKEITNKHWLPTNPGLPLSVSAPPPGSRRKWETGTRLASQPDPPWLWNGLVAL